MEFDQKDKKILQIFKESSNLTTSRIAKKTSIPVTTVHNRIRKLSKKA
jgi:DNA-binding Lrp family transcriptional regulator